jgi:hypothetical protein
MSEIQVADGYGLVWHTRARVDTFEEITAILDVFSGLGLSADRIGVSDEPRRPFDAEVLREWIARNGGFLGDTIFERTKSPKYVLDCGRGAQPDYWAPTLVMTKAPAPRWVLPLFEAHAQMCGILRPLFGTLLPFFRNIGEVWTDDAALNITTRFDLMVYGLPPLGARTWLGPYAVQQIGRARLESAPDVVLRDQADGAVMVDLSPEPWTLDGPTCLSRARAVTAHLAESGAFGDYREPIRFKRPYNPRWVPPPDAVLPRQR